MLVIAPVAANSLLRPYVLSFGPFERIAVTGMMRNGHVMVGVASVARRIHCPLARRGARFYLRLDDQTFEFRAWDNVVRSNSQDLYHLGEVPRLVDGDLYVSMQDLQRVLALRSDGASDPSFKAFETRKGARSAPAQPHDTGRPLNNDAAHLGYPPSLSPGGSGEMVLRFSLAPGQHQPGQLQLDGNGKTIRGEMTSDATSLQSWPYGVIAIGSEERFGQFGQQQDALSGAVFYPARASGETYTDTARNVEYFDVLRNDVRRYVGVKKGAHNRTYTVAAETAAHHISGALIGIADRRASPQGMTERELWISSRGVAVGLYAQTAGRLFAESVTSLATSAFPRDLGDGPFRENMGYRFSPALTLRAGVASAYGVHASAYFNGSFNVRNIALLATKSAASNSFGLTAHGESAYGTISYSSAPRMREWRIDGASALGTGQVQLLASSIGGDSDAALEWRSTQNATALVLGFEALQEGAARVACPIVGVSFALNRDLAAQVETRATSSGRAMRMSFTQRINVASRKHSVRTRIHLVRTEASQAVRFIVDGDVLMQASSNDIVLETNSGRHMLSVRSLDGSTASLPIDFESGVPTAVPLYSVRAVAGQISVADPADFVQAPSLEHIEVQLSPGNATVSTDAGGRFTLPAGPIAPDARVQVVEESLPDELRAANAAKVKADGTVMLSVLAKHRIQRMKFP